MKLAKGRGGKIVFVGRESDGFDEMCGNVSLGHPSFTFTIFFFGF